LYEIQQSFSEVESPGNDEGSEVGADQPAEGSTQTRVEKPPALLANKKASMVYTPSESEDEDRASLTSLELDFNNPTDVKTQDYSSPRAKEMDLPQLKLINQSDLDHEGENEDGKSTTSLEFDFNNATEIKSQDDSTSRPEKMGLPQLKPINQGDPGNEAKTSSDWVSTQAESFQTEPETQHVGSFENLANSIPDIAISSEIKLAVESTPNAANQDSSSESSNEASVFSRDTLRSSSSQSSFPNFPLEEAALQNLVEFLTNDSELVLLLTAAFEAMDQDRLTRNLATSLRNWAREIRKSPSAEAQSLNVNTARFIRSRSTKVAEMTRTEFCRSQPAWQQAEIMTTLSRSDASESQLGGNQVPDVTDVEENGVEQVPTCLDEKETDIEFDFQPAKSLISSGLPFLHFKKDLRSWLKRTLDSPEHVMTVTFTAEWDVRRVLDGFDSPQVLGSLLTLTGTASTAWAATCREYVKWRLPKNGLEYLSIIEDALGSEFSYCGISSLLFIDLEAY